MATNQKSAPQYLRSEHQQDTAKNGRHPRSAALRKAWLLWLGTAVLALATAYGFLLDRSIRADPFSPTPGLWQWFSNSQPHPALARIPVVPVGEWGSLTYRPVLSGWINSTSVNVLQDQAAPTQAARMPLVGSALAVDERLAQAETLPMEQQQQQQQQLTAPPQQQQTTDAPLQIPAKFLQGQCLAGGLRCWLAAVGDRGGLWWTTDGGASWSRSQIADQSSVYFVIFGPEGNNGVAVTWQRRPWAPKKWATSDQGNTWLEEKKSLAHFDGLVLIEYMMKEGEYFYNVAPIDFLNDSSEPRAKAVFDTGTRRYQRLEIGSDQQVLEVPTPYLGKVPGMPVANLTLVPVREENSATFLTLITVGETDNDSALEEKTAWLVGDHGVVAEVVFENSDGEWAAIGWSQKTATTKASLRSIYFQPDGEIGWASSGWNDGNEEGERPVVLQTTDAGETWERLSYRHRPAPWLLYLAMPGMVLAFFGAATATFDARTMRPPRAGIEDAGSSDRPIGWDDPDVLGLQPLARALSRFVRNRSTEPPLTIAISGAWGTGKSSLMNLVTEDLEESGTKPVWFNAWHHQKEEHLLAALLENIGTQAVPAWWRLSGIWLRIRLIWRRSKKDAKALAATVFLLGSAVLAINTASAGKLDPVIEWAMSMLKGAEEDGAVGLVEIILGGALGLAGVSGMLFVLIKAAQQWRVITLSPAKLMASISERARVGDFRDQLGFRYKFAQEFGEVCETLRSGSNAGVVIMIDDLDRCRPDNVLDVLEAVNFLTSAGPCFIFLGIDEEKVISSVAHGFKDSVLDLPNIGMTEEPSGDDGSEKKNDLHLDAVGLARFSRNYLEKLLNVTVAVPVATAENSAGLTAAGENEMSSPLPRRIRGWIRDIQDLLPLLVIPIVFYAAFALFSDEIARFATLPDTAEQPAESSDTALDILEIEGEGTSTLPGAGAPSTDNPDEVEETVEVPPVAIDDLRADVSVLPWAILALIVVWIVFKILQRFLEPPEDDAEDTPDFIEAMRLWHPIIFLASPSPRGVKRHHNRIRFKAMRMRPLESGPTWLEKWFGAENPDAGSMERPHLSDETLVALGAIEAFAPQLLEEDPESIETDLIQLLLKRVSEEPSVAEARRVAVLTEFTERFSGSWPPTQDQIDAYRGLARGARD